MPSDRVKSLIQNAKDIAAPIYYIGFINFILFVGLIIRDLPLLYIVGAFVISVILVTMFSNNIGVIGLPQQFVSENVKRRVNEIQENVISFYKRLNLSKLDSDSIKSIVTSLLLIYLFSVLNSTLQVFLVVNVTFLAVFLPEQFDGYVSVLQESKQMLIKKVKYQEQ